MGSVQVTIVGICILASKHGILHLYTRTLWNKKDTKEFSPNQPLFRQPGDERAVPENIENKNCG